MESCCLEMKATDSKHCILLLRICPARSKQQILLLRIVPAFSKQQILLLRILPARSKHGFLLLRSRSKHEIVTLSVDTFIPSTRLFRNPKCSSIQSCIQHSTVVQYHQIITAESTAQQCQTDNVFSHRNSNCIRSFRLHSLCVVHGLPFFAQYRTVNHSCRLLIPSSVAARILPTSVSSHGNCIPCGYTTARAAACQV